MSKGQGSDALLDLLAKDQKRRISAQIRDGHVPE